MLTPSFDIEQDEEFVILRIRVPYIKISDAEFYINGHEFKFYCKPYFLRLHLPGEIIEDGKEKAKYDIDTGVILVHIPKRNRDEHFDNLGMITSLLSNKPKRDLTETGARPLVEVVGVEEEETEEREEEEFDWQVEQQLPDEEEELSVLAGLPGYGFSQQHRGVFSKLQEEIPNIVDCPDPDHMTSHERRVARIAHEETSFDAEHYLADLMDNPYIEVLLEYQPTWKEELSQWKVFRSKSSATLGASKPSVELAEPGQDILPFSLEEKEQLKELPNKEYLLDKASRKVLFLSLVDIIFAYAYNCRTTEGENNVESAWTICKLSPTLSWLEVFRGSAHEVVYCCLRRVLCYPLYRHWNLALSVLQDTRDIFHLGRRKLLQCLLSIRKTLYSSEPYYILNNLYITDFCIWIQKTSAKQISGLAMELDEVKVEQSSVGWDLAELEEAARLVLAEGEEEGTEEEEEEGETESNGSGSSETSELSGTSSSAEASSDELTSAFNSCCLRARTPLERPESDGSAPDSPEQRQSVVEKTREELCFSGELSLPAILEKLTISGGAQAATRPSSKPLIEEVDKEGKSPQIS